MNEDKSILDSIWFAVRWYTGTVIDFLMTIGAIALAGWTFDKVFGVNPVVKILMSVGVSESFVTNNPFINLGMAFCIFSAAMSGRQWFRHQYFTYVMPEIWEDTLSQMIKTAKKGK